MNTSAINRPMVGILWMLVTGLCFVAVTALVKFMGSGVPPAQSAFLRYVIGSLMLAPVVWRVMRDTKLTPRQWTLFGVRGTMHAVGVILWFYAMTRIPIAEVTAMNYLSPVYVTILAAIFLGEKLAMRRIAAILVALLGTLIILRPGFREVNPGHLAMLLAAVVFGGSYILAKITADEVHPGVVVGMLSLVVTITLAPFAAADWVTPTLYELAILCGVAAFATFGHYAMTLALRAAPIAVTQPITFLQLIWATALGVLVFDEGLDVWVVTGGCFILAAISFITWREVVLKRRIVAPPAPATKF
ncbi:MAG: DMT family transporter [Rhodobacteraceae bacterium]|nr:DMT family transporter [Paracoccaceae bacterium]